MVDDLIDTLRANLEYCTDSIYNSRKFIRSKNYKAAIIVYAIMGAISLICRIIIYLSISLTFSTSKPGI